MAALPELKSSCRAMMLIEDNMPRNPRLVPTTSRCLASFQGYLDGLYPSTKGLWSERRRQMSIKLPVRTFGKYNFLKHRYQGGPVLEPTTNVTGVKVFNIVCRAVNRFLVGLPLCEYLIYRWLTQYLTFIRPRS